MAQKPKKQHIVPKAYLKYWEIDDNKNKSHVYGINLKDKYKKGIQRFGLNHKVFKEVKYYNDKSFKNPYYIEYFLSKNVENRFPKIMDEVIKEVNLSTEIRDDIISWLYFSNARSPIIRNNLKRISSHLQRVMEYMEGNNLSDEKEIEIENNANKGAKEYHLKFFNDNDVLLKNGNLFKESLLNKQWRILKSNRLLEFWTNDNPGFSPNLIERFAVDEPYHSVMEMNKQSIVYYPLSPKYCLEIKPFDESNNISNEENIVKYEYATFELIEFINKGVFSTAIKMLVSKSKESLELCVKVK